MDMSKVRSFEYVSKINVILLLEHLHRKQLQHLFSIRDFVELSRNRMIILLK